MTDPQHLMENLGTTGMEQARGTVHSAATSLAAAANVPLPCLFTSEAVILGLLQGQQDTHHFLGALTQWLLQTQLSPLDSPSANLLISKLTEADNVEAYLYVDLSM